MNTMLQSFFSLYDPLRPIITAIKAQGGTVYLVGGSVRDLVLGCPLNDFDIEVHGLPFEALEKLLQSYGPVMLVGKKFGVLRLAHSNVDWSLPRRDSVGRKPEVTIDPFMSLEQAARRRDVTMNAMAIDLHLVEQNYDPLHSNLRTPLLGLKQASIGANGSESPDHPEGAQRVEGSGQTDHYPARPAVPAEALREGWEEADGRLEGSSIAQAFAIIDPFNGLDAIKHKQLRAIDNSLFLEDPLRFYRVMHFIGRFGMQPDENLNKLCASMALWDATTNSPIAAERVYDEVKKLLLLSVRPSLGFRWLLDIGRLGEVFPPLQTLVTTPQRPDYHPEGSVFEHTMQSLDAAARFTLYQDGPTMTAGQEKLMLLLAALCHDLGKPATTDAQLRAYGHDRAGVLPAQELLKCMTNDQGLIKAVCIMVRNHLHPFQLVQEKSSPQAYKRLAAKIAPAVTLRQLGMLALADWQGRNGAGPLPLDQYYDVYQAFMEKAENAYVAHGPEAPVLLGKHLLDVVQPGPKLGELLKKAYQIQLEEGVSDWQELKRRVAP